jgi:hypothetical protein
LLLGFSDGAGAVCPDAGHDLCFVEVDTVFGLRELVSYLIALSPAFWDGRPVWHTSYHISTGSASQPGVVYSWSI